MGPSLADLSRHKVVMAAVAVHTDVFGAVWRLSICDRDCVEVWLA